MSPERKIQDYIHFYIGGQILLNWRQEEDVICTIINAGVSGGSFVTGTTKDGKTFNSHGSQETGKLILRPLSDMTEEEKAQSDKFNSLSNFELAEWFRYLLSLGFDLFNLIPDGLAIDKTALKP